MSDTCANHPTKKAAVRGMCQACYMKARRDAARAYSGQTDKRWPTGASVAFLLSVWTDDFQARFVTKVDRTAGGGCHLWTGTKNTLGYGMFAIGGKQVLAHRLAHALATGDATAPVVMHTCDNPSCVNPSHLRRGTHMDNVADMHAKGRNVSPTGDHLRIREAHPRAQPVRTPRGEFPSAALAAEDFGLNQRTVSRWCALGKNKKGGWRRDVDDPAKPGWSYLD